MMQQDRMKRLALPLFIIALPAGFYVVLAPLFFLMPDAGPGALVFFPIAAVGALVVAGAITWIYRRLIHRRRWAGQPVLAMALLGAVLLASVLSWRAMFAVDPEVQQMLQTTCVADDPQPGEDVSHCAVRYTLPVDQNPARELFATYGWTVEPGTAEVERIRPAMGAVWRIGTDFSRDIGLEFQPAVGAEVRALSFPIRSERRLPGPAGPCQTHGRAVLDSDNRLIGAWVECWTANGPSRALPGYSLRGRSVQEVTGSSWTWYRLKYDR